MWTPGADRDELPASRAPRPLKGCAWVAIAGGVTVLLAVAAILWGLGDVLDDPDAVSADALAAADRVAQHIKADNDGGTLASVREHARVEGLLVDHLSAAERPATIWLRAPAGGAYPSVAPEICVRIDGVEGRVPGSEGSYATSRVDPCPEPSPVEDALAYAHDADGLIAGADASAYTPDRPRACFTLDVPAHEPGTARPEPVIAYCES